MSRAMESDKRFSHIATDPKFRRIPKTERKVKIDKRFQSMFTDKKFKVKYTVDKRGRPVNHTTTEDLKRYYHLDSDEETGKHDEPSSEDHNDADIKQINVEIKGEPKGNDVAADDLEQELRQRNVTDKVLTNKVKKQLKNLSVDYARGEGCLLSDSSSDEEESEIDEGIEDDDIDHKWGELDADAARTDTITKRLAACNMDWDRIRAVDLMVLFNSFLPPGGSISSVTIYPSEFGKQRMAEEEVKGPIELVKDSNDISDDDDNGHEDGSKYHMEKLRQYQLTRLKYYYAVVIFDNENSANKVYTECDGMEYESSATKIDLRFIPDDVQFEDDVPKEVCSQLPEGKKYQPRFFTTSALQQAKVDLTWDETDPGRIEMTQKLSSGKIDDINDADLQAYLASSSDEEDENDGDKDDENVEESLRGKSAIEKYKLLLQGIESKEKLKEEKDVGMEIKWGIDLEKKTEQIMKEKQSSRDEKTPFEQFLDKRKEKRKEKRAAKKNGNADDKEDEESDSDVPDGIDMNDPYFAEEFNKPEFRKSLNNKKKLNMKYNEDSEDDIDAESRAQLELLLNDDDDGKKHFSLKQIQDQENESKSKKKRKNKGKLPEVPKPEDDFEVNVRDERFSALFTSHHYNIDPTDPHFKKTKNMEKLINEKIRRRTETDEEIPTKKAKLNKNGTNQKQKSNAELSVLVKSVKRKAEAFKHKRK